MSYIKELGLDKISFKGKELKQRYRTCNLTVLKRISRIIAFLVNVGKYFIYILKAGARQWPLSGF